MGLLIYALIVFALVALAILILRMVSTDARLTNVGMLVLIIIGLLVIAAHMGVGLG